MADTTESSLFELSIDHESIQHLTETARWGKFLAIVGFITCGLMVILSFFMGSILGSTAFSNYPGYSGDTSRAMGLLGGTFIAAIYIVVAAVYFFPCLFLYNFSVRLRAALRTNDQLKLNQSLKNQKLLFRYMGIVAIVTISIYAMVLLIAGIAMAVTRG